MRIKDYLECIKDGRRKRNGKLVRGIMYNSMEKSDIKNGITKIIT